MPVFSTALLNMVQFTSDNLPPAYHDAWLKAHLEELHAKPGSSYRPINVDTEGACGNPIVLDDEEPIDLSPPATYSSSFAYTPAAYVQRQLFNARRHLPVSKPATRPIVSKSSCFRKSTVALVSESIEYLHRSRF